MCAICWKCFFNVHFDVVLWVCCALCSFSIDLWISLTVLSRNNTQQGGLSSILLVRLTAESPFDLLNYAKNVSIPVWNGLFIVTRNVCMKLQKKRVAFIFQCRCRINPCHYCVQHQDTFIRKLSIRRTSNKFVSSKQKSETTSNGMGPIYWNMAQT